MPAKRDLETFLAYFKPKGAKTGYLATAAARGRPAVRPVTFFPVNGRLYFCTFAGDAKVAQLKKNAAVEVCLPVNRGRWRGYYRIAGEARVVGAPRTRAAVLKRVPYKLESHWSGRDDPNLVVVNVVPAASRYLAPGRAREEDVTL